MITWIRENVNHARDSFKFLHTYNEHGNTPLYVAINKGHLRITQLLIRLGGRINFKNEFGNTPLNMVMIKGDLKAISLLIQSGGNAASFNAYYQTPVDFCPPLLVKELGFQNLESGINPSIRDKIVSGKFANQKFLIYDEIAQKDREFIAHENEKWMDVFRGFVRP